MIVLLWCPYPQQSFMFICSENNLNSTMYIRAFIIVVVSKVVVVITRNKSVCGVKNGNACDYLSDIYTSILA